MPQTDTHVAQNEAPHANGGSTLHDLFALTDEQILEMEPESQEAVASGERQEANQQTPPDTWQQASPNHSNQEGAVARNAATAEAATAHSSTSHDAATPPGWLAAQMKDPWTGHEAQELWNGVQQAKSEAAAYRASFATPEDARALKELYPGGVNEARAAAERARTLDDIDRAYFGAAGSSAEQTSAARAQLAQTMLREDPAAFREMVFAGLRALEEAGNQPGATVVGATLGSPGADGGAAAAGGASPAPASLSVVGAQHAAPQPSSPSIHEAHVAAYSAFEKAANEDLERSVGAAIARRLEQALPNLSRTADSFAVEAQHRAEVGTGAAPLQARLNAAVRNEIESALKGDRQLGEQIAQILSARRFDNETRAQVVRLIGERAQQLVPGATKRVLNEWTQTTLAAHRGKSERADPIVARREVAFASGEPRGVPANQRATTSRPVRNDATKTPAGRVDYRKLSDEQILDL